MFSFRTLKPHPTPGRRLKVNGRRRSKSLACSPVGRRAGGRRRAAAVGHVGLRAGGACWDLQASCCFAAIAGAPGRCWWRPWRSAWRCSTPSPACCRPTRDGLRPGAHDGAALVAAARSHPGLPAQAQQRGLAHRDLRARDRSIAAPITSTPMPRASRRRRRPAPTPISSWATPSSSARACPTTRRWPRSSPRRTTSRCAPSISACRATRPTIWCAPSRPACSIAMPAQPVKAVVTWIIPAQLARVTGDGSWLGSSPRYVLEDGKLAPHRLVQRVPPAPSPRRRQVSAGRAVRLRRCDRHEAAPGRADRAVRRHDGPPAAVRAREVQCAAGRDLFLARRDVAARARRFGVRPARCWSACSSACASSASR